MLTSTQETPSLPLGLLPRLRAKQRRARELSQARLAEALEIDQSEVSRIEHRTDLYLSTQRSYIEAMGGELEIIARFPDGAVRVRRLDDLDKGDRSRR